MPTVRDVFDAFVWIIGKLGWGWGMSFLFFVATIVLGILFVKANSKLKSEKKIAFFKNRPSLPHKDLNDELKTSGTSFWVIWQAGHHVPNLEPYVCEKIRRMILGNPKAPDDVLKEWAKAAHATKEIVCSRINEATRIGKDKKVEVRWTDEKSLSLVIANPESNDSSGSIRMEFIIPYLLPTARPSLKIYEKDYPQLFKDFVEAYKEMWEHSKPSD